MKKGFGWFFSILGVLSSLRGAVMLSNGINGSTMLLIGIGLFILGLWMIDSSKSKDKKTTEGNQDNIPQISSPQTGAIGQVNERTASYKGAVIPRKTALKWLVIWCAFHLFALVMSYSRIEIFNNDGSPETEKFWPFAIIHSFVTTSEPDYAHQIYYIDKGYYYKVFTYEGLFANYDWTEFAVYVGGAILIFVLAYYFNNYKE